MKVSPLRSLALVAATLVGLAGCAVPGKGEPGVIATYHDQTVTDGDITTFRLALKELCSASDVVDGEELTLLLVGPEVVSVAEGLGYRLTDEQLTSQAGIWIAFTEDPRCQDNVPSADALEVVRIVQSLALLMHDAEGIIALVSLALDIEQNAIVSPRYGSFTLENFDASVTAIKQYIADNALALGPAEFLFWKGVNGFSVTDQPDWISGE